MIMKKYLFLFTLGISLGLMPMLASANEDRVVVRAVEQPEYDEETFTCEGTRHVHYHRHTSTDTPRQEFWEVVHAFAIVLDSTRAGGNPAQNDFMSNVDTNELLCTNGNSVYVDCHFDKNTTPLGTVVYSDPGGRWNGVTITYQRLDWISGSPRGLLWEYGTQNASDITLKPWLASGDQKLEAISFHPENYDNYKTATTESWTKVEFYWINPNADYSDLSNWNQIYPVEVDTDGDGTDDIGVDSDNDYVFWWGKNSILRSGFEPCLGCADLTLVPSVGRLNNIGGDISLSVSAVDANNNDVSDELEYNYTAEGFNGQNANGHFEYGTLNARNGGTDLTTDDRSVDYVNVSAGDSITVSAVGFEGTCTETLEIPYCSDLTLTNPPAYNIVTGSFEETIEVEVNASNGAPWPFDLTFSSSDPNATFNGQTGSLTTRNRSVLYSSQRSGTVTIQADNDVASVCVADFTYNVNAAAVCDFLNITEPAEPVSVTDMQNGNLRITWESMQTDGSVSTGPWTITSSNPDGIFRTPDASRVLGTGSVTSFSPAVLYTGNPGDSLEVVDVNDATCSDTLSSEPLPNAPVCEDTEIDGPYNVDLEPIENPYDESVVCFSYDVQVEEGFAGNLIAENLRNGQNAGNIVITDDSGLTASGNRARLRLDGATQFTGTACLENFQENDSFNLFVQGQRNVCETSFEFPEAPEPEEEPVCRALNMSPQSYVLPADAEEHRVTLDIDVQGETEDWFGTLVVETTGDGQLFYINGDPSEFEDGRLELPVNGTFDLVNVQIEGADARDRVFTYIRNEKDVCRDSLSFLEDSPVCTGLELDPDRVVLPYGEESETIRAAVNLQAERNEWTGELVIELESQNGRLLNSRGEIEDSETQLNFDVEGARDRVTFEFEELEAGDQIKAYVLGEEDLCIDRLTIEEDEPRREFGEFRKSIFTFNFASEKNPYTDEQVFFSHDEDRLFYTLEYNPTGAEDDIVFTDKMWEESIDGVLGNGEASGGRAYHATTYEELTSGRANGDNYNYNTILNFGLGDRYETNSQALADQVRATYNRDKFPTYIPYIRYGSEDFLGSDITKPSELIEECVFNDENGELENNTVCYDPTVTPEDNGMVRIYNAGEVERDFGEDAVIRIRYVGVVDSADICDGQSDECLTETFENRAALVAYPDAPPLQTSARLVVLCSYLTTTNAGDIYLEVDLKTGSDVACIFVDEDDANSSDYRNSDALVIIGDNGEGSSNFSSLYSNYSDSSVSSCDDRGDNLVGNISSYICEIRNQQSTLIDRPNVENQTNVNVSSAIRNAETNQGSETRFSSWAELERLKNLNNPNNGVLYFDGSKVDEIVLDSIVVPEGAWVLVVENADLRLRGNITYAESSNFAKIPSLGVIVVDGDIYIEDSARTLSGFYYTNQDFDGDQRSAVNEPLTIIGSLYGNVQKLIDAAEYVGPPRDNGGGVSVYYDSRILINAHPVLSEYVNVRSEEAIN